MTGGGDHSTIYRGRMIEFYTLQILYISFLERGEGRDKDRERNINVREKHRSVSSLMRPTQGLNPQLGMFPDRESNWVTSTLQNDT